MPVTSDDFVKAVTESGFFPVRVQGEADVTKFKGDLFKGTLEEFFNAAKVLGAKCVFIAASRLTKEYFLYSSAAPGDDELDDERYDDERAPEEFAEVDLTIALPKLSEFRKEMGKEGEFILTAKGGYAELSFHHYEAWWDAFLEQREQAISKVEKDRGAYLEKMQRRLEEQEEKRLKLLRDLINDGQFVHIPTQRAMKAYAVEKHPELAEMDQTLLTTQIQILSDRIKAKGLDKIK